MLYKTRQIRPFIKTYNYNVDFHTIFLHTTCLYKLISSPRKQNCS